MIHTLEEMKALVDVEMSQITDPIVYATIKAMVVTPLHHLRNWWDDKIECWSILEDKSQDFILVYSEIPYNPKCPWGIGAISELEMGHDSHWFPNLERAFMDSFPAGDLKIWNLLKKDENGEFHPIETDLTLDEAFAKRDPLIPIIDYQVAPRNGYRW